LAAMDPLARPIRPIHFFTMRVFVVPDICIYLEVAMIVISRNCSVF